MEWFSNYIKFGRIIKIGSLTQITSIPEGFVEVIGKYVEQCYEVNNTDKTINKKLTYIYHFIAHLKVKSVTNPREIDRLSISDFPLSLAKYSGSTASATLSCIRNFLKIIYLEGFNSQNLSYSLPKPPAFKAKKIQKVWTDDEIQTVLKQIDTGSPIGKRNYAIILLAVKLGIRSGDICELKLNNIKWEVNKIDFIQLKTMIPISLPLDNDVGIAIIDYLKNARPKCKSQYIFLKPQPPFNKIESCSPILKKYMALAGMSTQKHVSSGFHTLRHTLASKLLEQNVDLKFVSDILGHVDSNAAKYYLHVDIQGLRKCAMSIGEVFVDDEA